MSIRIWQRKMGPNQASLKSFADDARKHVHIERPAQSGRELSLGNWAGYPFFAQDTDDVSDIPNGSRLDDYTVALLIDSGNNTGNSLNSIWSTEFDTNGMIKARRMPLGYAAKMYVREGDLDRNGQAATSDGWYYKWYRGLHVLCGLEGMHRPDWEYELTNTWYFDKNSRCVYQEDERGPMAEDQFKTHPTLRSEYMLNPLNIVCC